MEIIKRNGTKVKFDSNKIKEAILKTMKNNVGIIETDIAERVAKNIETKYECLSMEPTVSLVETDVYLELIKENRELVAKAYESYRSIAAYKRENNTIDDSILSLIAKTNEELIAENSNKDGILLATQRDLIAGEVSKDITQRKLLPTHIVQAHNEGILHYHDQDYAMQKMFNCCLINIQNMLDNGTVINKRTIDSPKGFQVACTVTTQIIAQIACAQYGGQSVNIAHLGKYLRRTREKIRKLLEPAITNKEELDEAVKIMSYKELQSGVQTIQYQINTLMTTNGQSPFVTLFLDLQEDNEYVEEIADIIEEILIQRLEGIKNEAGVPSTIPFPKLVYVLYPHNCLEGGKYDYLTKLAAKCSAKRLYPDYISSKEMKKIYEGNVFSPMGQQ